LDGCEAVDPTDFPCGACFPASATVMTPHGSKPIREVDVGDLVLSGRTGQFTRVVAFIDRVVQTSTPYLRLHHSGNSSLLLSHDHFVWIEHDSVTNQFSQSFIKARNVRVGMTLLVQTEQRAVIAISEEQHEGAYSPLTADGTLLVDGVYASCYSSAPGVEASYAEVSFWLTPLRWFASLAPSHWFKHSNQSYLSAYVEFLIRLNGRYYGASLDKVLAYNADSVQSL